MNYYNPYFYMLPSSAARPSLFASLRGALGGSGITLGNVISGTQKTLGLVNQAIPIIKQVTPVLKNAKTMFRVMNEFKKVDAPSLVKNDDDDVKENLNENVNSSSGPVFFA